MLMTMGSVTTTTALSLVAVGPTRCAQPQFKYRVVRVRVQFYEFYITEKKAYQAARSVNQMGTTGEEPHGGEAKKAVVVVAFDLYGTILSTESIAQQLAEHVGKEKAETIAASWRTYQEEYTWRLNSMGKDKAEETDASFVYTADGPRLRGCPRLLSAELYRPFSEVARNALLQALAEASETLAEEAIDGLMEAFDDLSTFSDVTPALEDLAKAPNIIPVIFSNGTPSMVSQSVHHSKDLSPYSSVFKEIIVVDDVQRYKPHPTVYSHLARRLEKHEAEISKIWLVSGNPFDIVGARNLGMKAAWVDRMGRGWTDKLIAGDKGRPSLTGKRLDEVVHAILTEQ